MLASVSQAQAWDPELSVAAICDQLGLPRAKFYRWQARQADGQLADRVVVPRRQAVPPTPPEVTTVRNYAHGHPELGYKRLAWTMVDENVAFLRPGMVYAVLAEAQLLGRRQPAPTGLRRPAEADHPDQRWHTDLMSLYFAGRWFWLVDVLDAYSRYLIDCEVLLTARASVVERALQRALETLDGRWRLPGEPEIVHDNGPQFLGREWLQLVRQSGMTDVRTLPYHPQSNGRDERFHRTLREEVCLAEDDTLYEVQRLIAEYRVYYNERRAHSALHYLRPIDYYRGDPAARLAEREAKLRAAAEARNHYWGS